VRQGLLRYSDAKMGSQRRERGYTLIELMITVVIVGILATIGVVGYRRWTRSAHVAEAQNMVANIRAAEDAFFAENGGYLDVSGTLGKGYSYPSANPGASKTQWGALCGTCKAPDSWSRLAVTSSAPVMFGYSVIADQATPATTRVPAITVNGQPLDITNLGMNGQPWYFVEADANISGDGKSFTHVYGMSGTNQIYVDGEGN
jgi:prepilin-type N-terminal cleavage/methylation domain-containing protein